MSERRVGIRLMEMEADSTKVWKDVFVNSDKFAKLKGKPVTQFANFFTFGVVLSEDEVEEYMLRVNNAAMDERGKPRIIVLDGHFQGRHTQQIVLEAKWQDDEPEITTNDPSKMPGASLILPYELLGMISNEFMKHKINNLEQGLDDSLGKPDITIPVPDSYARGIN